MEIPSTDLITKIEKKDNGVNPERNELWNALRLGAEKKVIALKDSKFLTKEVCQEVYDSIQKSNESKNLLPSEEQNKAMKIISDTRALTTDRHDLYLALLSGNKTNVQSISSQLNQKDLQEL